MKLFLTILLANILIINGLAQDRYYVITEQLQVREKPDVKAKALGMLSLGDSVIVSEHSENQITATINDIRITADWVKILYQNKPAWVFSGGLCQEILNYENFKRFAINSSSDSTKILNDLKKLLQDSVLSFHGNFLKIKAKNGKTFILKDCVCLPDLSDCQTDGYRVYSLQINAQNPDIVEVEMSFLAYTMKIYLDLQKAKKFNFPESQHCMESSISPSGKYIMGLSITSPKPLLLLYDFATQKNIGQIYLASPDLSTQFKWLNDKELEVSEINTANSQIVRKRVLLIPQMVWKK